MRAPVVLFLDELQRAVDYEDGDAFLSDLVDIYAAVATNVVVLVDGSDERSIDSMMGPPIHPAKLAQSLSLEPTVPQATWREGVMERFADADFAIEPASLDQILEFGRGRPFETMAAAQESALAARALGGTTISRFEAQMGVDAARRRAASNDV